MHFILLGIFFNVLLFVIIKGFDRFKIPALQGIVINYFVAGSMAFFFIPEKINPAEIMHQSWTGISLVLGALFITVFYLLSLTSQKIGISVASVANKLSVVIPVCLAFYLYNDPAPAIKITGLVLALASVYLTVKPKEQGNTEKAGMQKILLPLFVFVGSGAIDAIVNYAQKTHLPAPSDTALFAAISFFVAGTIGVIIILFAVLGGKMKFNLKSIPAGIILGVPNYFSLYFVMLSIQKNVFESSVIYPIVNIGVVLGSALFGVLLFREKLSMWNYCGIILSVIAIAMIAGLF